ncbi:MAG: hypothetical protein NWF05_08960 [Candidatus Bathyarchaeota archaeon]|nr:hypothetical protein [Candidatus Bathyarchaeota archaeon]
MSGGVSTREEARIAILRVLSDEKPHRSKELGAIKYFSKNTIYKYRAELLEDGYVDVGTVSRRDPRTVYKITADGLKHYRSKVLESDGEKEFALLSEKEQIQEIMRLKAKNMKLQIQNKRYQVEKEFRDLPLPNRLDVLQSLAKKGDKVAAEKLKAIDSIEKSWKKFKKEFDEAPQDKKLEVYFKHRDLGNDSS